MNLLAVTVRCAHCDRELDAKNPLTWQRVTGWEKKATEGSRKGGSDIALRERVPGVYACDTCIARLRAGLSPFQESML